MRPKASSNAAESQRFQACAGTGRGLSSRRRMNLHSLLKTVLYRLGFSIKKIRPVPVKARAKRGDGRAGVDVRALLHAEDPYAGFDAGAWPPDLHGWGGDSPAFRELILETKPRLIVEVGTWKGASAIEMARVLADAGLPGEILCIDTWLGALEFWTDHDDPERYRSLRLRHGWPQVYYQFLANVVHRGHQSRIIPFPQTSATGALWLRYYDIRAELIYIDASHEEEDVLADLSAYWEVLAPGGTLFGDDYDWDGVRLAVQQFAGEHRLTIAFTADKWVLRKPH
jgi:Methyltransferase domain